MLAKKHPLRIIAGGMRDTLTRVFGFRDFRPNQEAVVRSILAGRDAFVVMPTGGGKSLCYQLPAKIMGGTAVVISPLISLMKDQVDAARANGIAAAFLNSSLRTAERARVHRELRSGSIELLYLAPERLALGGFLEEMRDLSISLFAVDEAHCISEWGHDFRPDYLGLSALKKSFPRVPLAAFTATATPRVQAEVIARLGLNSPLVVRASFDRPNLFLEVRRKDRAEEQLLEFLRARPGHSGIVYRTTRRSVESTAAFLEAHGIAARPYHAGLDAGLRRATQEDFKNDVIEVVVATIAFGMGIDKPNVRFVVHADLPKSVEGYYQEIGRAGRDGEPAHCLLLYSRADSSRLLHFIDEIENPAESEAALEKLERVFEYAAGTDCRRRWLLAHFGEDYPADNCGGCDLCTGEYERVEATDDARIVLAAAARTGQRFGAGHLIKVIAGADTERLRELGHDRIRAFGTGRHKSRRHWSSIIDELLGQGALKKEGGRYPTLRLTAPGAEILGGKRDFHVRQRREPQAPPRGEPTGDAAGTGRARATEGEYDRELFERLRALRLRLARRSGVAAYVVFHNRTLKEMCRALPTARGELAEITGVGAAKLERYGRLFLEEIRSHLAGKPDG